MSNLIGVEKVCGGTGGTSVIDHIEGDTPVLAPERSGVLVQYTEGEKVVLINQDTQEIVTPAIYARIDPFSEGLAAAYTEKEIHYLNEQGTVAITLERIPPTMQAESFDSGIAKVWLRLDEDIPGLEEYPKHPFAILSGLIDTNGAYILPLEYQTHDHCSHEWSKVGLFVVHHPAKHIHCVSHCLFDNIS